MISLLMQRMTDYGTAKALITNQLHYTYVDLLRLTLEAKSRIDKEGLNNQSVVVIVGDFSMTSIAVMLACLLSKTTIIPVTENAYKKLKDQLDALKPDFLINTFPPEPIISKYKHEVDETHQWQDLLPKSEAGLIVFTSGTTGTPKAILHSVDRLCYRYLTKKPPLNCICFLKFDHMGGFNTLLGILFRGGTAIIPSRLDPDIICREIELNKVDILPATPSFLTQLLVSKAIQRYNLDSLKIISYGTEVMSENILIRLNRELPQCKLKQTYGLSETGVFNIKSKSNTSLWFKFIDPGVEYKVVDDLLWIKTKSNLLGKLVFENQKVTIEPNTKEWFCTDDIVETDNDYFKIKSRVTDIINVGGLKVYPVEVENCILQLPYVTDVTVLAEKNPLIGEMVVAHIVLPSGVSFNAVKKEIKQHCFEHMERYKVPSKFVVSERNFVNDRFKKARFNA